MQHVFASTTYGFIKDSGFPDSRGYRNFISNEILKKFETVTFQAKIRFLQEIYIDDTVKQLI